jgi:hypothetical protein
MKVKIVNPENAIGLIDPHTRRSPFIDPETGAVVEVADVPEDGFWTRRIMHGELERVAETVKSATPTGREPVAPLTKR